MMYLQQDERTLQPLIHFNSSKPDIGERAALVKVGSKRTSTSTPTTTTVTQPNVTTETHTPSTLWP
jgi:hypothetical protein